MIAVGFFLPSFSSFENCIAQASLELATYARLALNLWTSYFSLFSDRITGLCHHGKFTDSFIPCFECNPHAVDWAVPVSMQIYYTVSHWHANIILDFLTVLQWGLFLWSPYSVKPSKDFLSISISLILFWKEMTLWCGDKCLWSQPLERLRWGEFEFDASLSYIRDPVSRF